MLSNFGARFSHSPAQRFAFADSRFGSRSWSFDRAGFGNHREFYGGEGGFGGREFWSGDNGGGYSFLPDLFGLALDFGGFGLRALNFLGGAGLNVLDMALSGDTGYGGYGSYGAVGAYPGYDGYDLGFNPAPPLLYPAYPYWVPAAIPYAPERGFFGPR